MAEMSLLSNSITHGRYITLADHFYEIDLVCDEMAQIIDPSTPIGHYVEQLERDCAEAEKRAESWRQRFAIASDECRRAERRASELEGLLDAALGGIDAKGSQNGRVPRLSLTLPLPRRPAARRLGELAQ